LAVGNNTKCIWVTAFCDDGEKIGCKILRLNTEKFEQSCRSDCLSVLADISSNIGIPAKFHIGASLNTTFKESTLLSLVWQSWILPAYA